MTILLLKGYNNYFNKLLKKEADITAYKTASTSYLEYASVNFNPNDGITTSLVVGGPTQQQRETVFTPGHPSFRFTILDFESGGSPDYLIVHDNVTIASRWFVLECVRVRAGQYQLSLKRDVLADFFDDFKDSPCYIEKATVTDLLSPLLYNSEGLHVNQIKSAEYLLKDSSGVAWVVGYVASNLASEPTSGNFGTIELDSNGQASNTILLPSNNYISFTLTDNSGNTVYAEGNSGDNKFNYTLNTTTKYLSYSINLPSLPNGRPVLRYSSVAPATVSGPNYSVNLAGDALRTHLTDAPYDMFCIPFGEITLNGANITTTKEAALEIAMEMSKDLGSNLYDIQLLPYCPRPDMIGNNKIYEVLGTVNYDYNYITKGGIIKSILIWCKESTHSINAMPDADIEIDRPLDATTYSGSLTDNAGRLTRLSNGYIQVMITNSNLIGLADLAVTGVSVHHSSGYNVATQATRNPNYNPVTGYLSFELYDGGSALFPSGILYDATVELTYTYKKYMYPEYLDRKVSNECDLFRLVSPNYNGQFEWSLAKGNGTANIFDVDFTYKPFQPYIHVAPIFTNLYGSDFNDARGLICGGDFSLPVTNDAWTQYQIQNKTYQEAFDRQINHMDRQNDFNQQSMGMTLANRVDHDFASLISSASHMNNISGAGDLAASAIRLTSDWTTGAKQQRISENSYQENRDFTIDMFTYSLQNVQALPYSLMKVAAYTANNKIFPMVEYYTCKPVERKAVRDKIKYNGMTVMVIGKISDYVSESEERFIKGQLIRLPEIADDSHVASEIYNEVSKGFYIGGAR